MKLAVDSKLLSLSAAPVDPLPMCCEMDVPGLVVLVREKQHTMWVLD